VAETRLPAAPEHTSLYCALARTKILICAPYSKERFETARQNSILHPERIVGNREVIPRNVRESEHCRPKLRELRRSQAAANV
jgi:hypothetical protein